MKLEGKSVIVTGGGGKGIGAATALLFARHGANVLINGTREERLRELVDKALEEGLNIKYIVADVSREDDCKKTVNKAVDEFGQLDILFNNAGVLVSGVAPPEAPAASSCRPSRDCGRQPADLNRSGACNSLPSGDGEHLN